MNIERKKLALILALDHVRNMEIKTIGELSKIDIINGDIEGAFEHKKNLKSIATVLEIRLGYVWKGDESKYPGTIREDASIVENDFLRRLEKTA